MHNYAYISSLAMYLGGLQNFIDFYIRTDICDRATKEVPSEHKPHLIIKLLISWVLHNGIMLCKL